MRGVAPGTRAGVIRVCRAVRGLGAQRPPVRYALRAEIASLLAALVTHVPAYFPPATAGAAHWIAWVKARDAAVRARVLRADEDSLAYLLVYGATFTTAPRITRAFLDEVTARAVADGTGPAGVERVVVAAIHARVGDLVSAAAAPGADERLAWVRATFDRLGLRVDTPVGAARARAYLLENFARVTRDSRQLGAALSEGQAGGERADFARRAHLFATRALASDTSWPIAFAVHDALADLRARQVLPAGGVRRVAVIGPGLDVIDKAEGQDYYRPQTVQPFATVDSLIALGLASGRAVRVTTFDVSPRVNQHLGRLVGGAAAAPYDLQLTLDPAVPWTPEAGVWWRDAGRHVGTAVDAAVPPRTAGALERRAVRVSPDVLRLFTPLDLNIVYQRADLARDERFNLVVATNVLIYYDRFEQALATANIAAMLAPDGILLTNDWLGDDDYLPLRLAGERLVRFSSRPGDGERMRAYRKCQMHDAEENVGCRMRKRMSDAGCRMQDFRRPTRRTPDAQRTPDVDGGCFISRIEPQAPSATTGLERAFRRIVVSTETSPLASFSNGLAVVARAGRLMLINRNQ